MKLIKFSLIIFFIFGNGAQAEELQAKFQDWSVFKTNRGDKNICYLASIPIKSGGNFYHRGEAFFIVTNIENDVDEISASSGFIYNQKSDVELSFGSKKFYLFPYKNLTWAQNKNDDIDIIKEMQKHEEITVTGIAANNKIAHDLYSLIGFNQAYEKMKQICKNL
jgi:hypothetical protein